MTKRIYVTPKDIKTGGVWDGRGKDAISKAMTRALGTRVNVGGSLFACNLHGKIKVGALPAKLTELHDRFDRTKPIDVPRFNFRVEV